MEARRSNQCPPGYRELGRSRSLCLTNPHACVPHRMAGGEKLGSVSSRRLKIPGLLDIAFHLLPSHRDRGIGGRSRVVFSRSLTSEAGRLLMLTLPLRSDSQVRALKRLWSIAGRSLGPFDRFISSPVTSHPTFNRASGIVGEDGDPGIQRLARKLWTRPSKVPPTQKTRHKA